MGKGHVILGQITDYLTGETVTETHDEQARQRIARFLVEEKGYLKSDISRRIDLPVTVDGKTDTARIDFALNIGGRVFAIITYAPGSVVSRQRPAVSAACLLEPYTIPRAVVTNGVDVQVLDVNTGKVAGEGFQAIPSRQEAASAMEGAELKPVPEKRREKAARILYAMEILAEKECDGTCEIP